MKKRQAKKLSEKIRQWEFTGKEYGEKFPIKWSSYFRMVGAVK